MKMTEKIRTPFADRLLRIRKGKGLTQRELARATSISPRMIAHYETNIQTPSADIVMRLAKALDVSIDQIMGRRAVAEKAPLIKSNRLLKKMKELEQLPQKDQKKVIEHINDLSAKYKTTV